MSASDGLSSWSPPRCRHGNILLGCPDESCPEQIAFLVSQRAQLDQWQEHQRQGLMLPIDGEGSLTYPPRMDSDHDLLASDVVMCDCCGFDQFHLLSGECLLCDATDGPSGVRLLAVLVAVATFGAAIWVGLYFLARMMFA